MNNSIKMNIKHNNISFSREIVLQTIFEDEFIKRVYDSNKEFRSYIDDNIAFNQGFTLKSMMLEIATLYNL